MSSSVEVSASSHPRSSKTPPSPDRRDDPSLNAEKPYGTLVDAYGNEFKIPDFTVKQIRDAIPPECFQRSALRGFGYVFRDLFLIGTTFYIFHTYVTPGAVPSYPARFALWSLYGFLNGLFATGIWVLAHECGHQSFSTSKVLNDTVGWVLHSSLLVPYFSWKISHGKHHKSTGHMERDMVFVPRTRELFAKRIGVLVEDLSEVAEDTPIHSALYLIARQLLAWPLYLTANNTGHNFHERQSEGRGIGKRNGFFKGVNHFSPQSPLFDAKDAKLILLSDLGFAITGSILYYIGQTYGWRNLLVWYFLPYLWVNNWLVAITYLQHTDPSIPHYNSATWTFARGAAATIDREFGFIGRHLFHGIIETHVVHHYVSTIPFYNAYKATEAIKPVMGEHYLANTKEGPIGFIKSAWKNVRWCQWVEPSAGAEGLGKDVLFYRNRNKLGTAPMNLKKN
ncbi:Oleate hydroxylase fah12 [Trichoglossum hirsutum]|uniref:Oleate hydroxylase fah12 n=1 Tax=Trichoglossum hirsutum TaxID=265104 RepID=A0A9P8IGB2_9PEZI|nr:Oleate hydroxylase fah12 [Trichoglossum hirsutum]